MLKKIRLALAALVIALLTVCGCGLTKGQVTTDVSSGLSLACTLSAVLTKTLAPSATTANEVLGIVCPDVGPVVNAVGSFIPGDAAAAAQCPLVPLDDSKRWGGDGKARPNQLVCAGLKSQVEGELAKPPAARIGAAKKGAR